MVAQENDKRNSAVQGGGTPEARVHTGTDHTFQVGGADVTLHDYRTHPDGTPTTSGMSFRKDIRARVAGAASSQQSSAIGSLFEAQSLISAPQVSSFDKALSSIGVEQLSGAISPGDLSRGLLGPSVSLGAQGEGFASSAGLSDSGIWLGYSGAGMEEFSRWLSNGQTTLTQATLLFDGQKVVLTPTLVAEPIPGFSFSTTTTIDSIFEGIEGRHSLYDHSLSGSPDDPFAGMRLGESRLFMNQYSFANSPGASVFKFDLVPDHTMSNLSLLVGATPGMGNFVGLRSSFEAQQRGGVWSPVQSRHGESLFGPRKTNYYFAQGDVLYQQRPDGTHGIGGSIAVEWNSFNRERPSDSLLIKLNVDRDLGEFGRPDSTLNATAGDQWSGSLWIELRR
jgi:hypothetical protein